LMRTAYYREQGYHDMVLKELQGADAFLISAATGTLSRLPVYLHYN
jgi:hypothetical protein